MPKIIKRHPVGCLIFNLQGGTKNVEGNLDGHTGGLFRAWRSTRLVLGGVDGFMYALMAFVAIDYVTGVMCAISDHSLSSEVGFRGNCRKVLIFVLVGVGHILDANVLGQGDVMRTAVIFFYLSNEGVSLLENAAHLGLPIPDKLKEILAQLHNRKEDDDDE